MANLENVSVEDPRQILRGSIIQRPQSVSWQRSNTIKSTSHHRTLFGRLAEHIDGDAINKGVNW